MLSKYFPNHFTRFIPIGSVLMLLLSACLGQVPTRAPVTVQTATSTSTDLPTRTATPQVQPLQLVHWRISTFTCDKNGVVETVTVEVTAEGGTLPYAYTLEGFAESNPPAAKQVPPTEAQPTATAARKVKNATATPAAPPVRPFHFW